MISKLFKEKCTISQVYHDFLDIYLQKSLTLRLKMFTLKLSQGVPGPSVSKKKGAKAWLKLLIDTLINLLRHIMSTKCVALYFASYKIELNSILSNLVGIVSCTQFHIFKRHFYSFWFSLIQQNFQLAPLICWIEEPANYFQSSSSSSVRKKYIIEITVKSVLLIEFANHIVKK